MPSSFRQIINRAVTDKRILVVPGAHDALSARLIQRIGFETYFIGGFPTVGARYGVPDLGLISPDEIVARLSGMVDVVGIPIVADADTGYGNALNAQRAARAFERAGVAAFHLEELTFPKKCGHYDEKTLVAPTRRR